MKVASRTAGFTGRIARLFADWRHSGRHAAEDRTPLRAELFSAEQMAEHGKVLARTHQLGRSGVSGRLLGRLDDNEQVLIASYKLLTAAIKLKVPIAPAGEWLLDNFYLIEAQIRIARLHLPPGYSRELPRLGNGPSADLPRVYDLALEAISHGDGRIDADTLARFVDAYQSVCVLALGELWAIPIMLRLALIENLRRIGARLTANRRHVNLAQEWANRMIAVAVNDPTSLILAIADMARSAPPMVSPFVAELARRLQGTGPALALALTWIEQRLAESGQTIESMVLSENQQQAADQLSISNTVGSLRLLGAMDWRTFVESMSLVETILCGDVGGVYAGMDFASRDRYRHVVEHLARHSPGSEVDVARAAIELSRSSHCDRSEPACREHVGYYLIDRGLPLLERAVGARQPLRIRWRRWLGRMPLALYLGAIVSITALSALAFVVVAAGGALSVWQLGLVALLALVACSQLAATLGNWLTTLLVQPQLLPRMDFSDGIPVTFGTLVAVPCLLTHADHIEALLESLEVRFLGNRDAHLHFALLSDFCDAPEQHLPGDEALLQLVATGIERLNEKYADGDSERFFLLHRPRHRHVGDGVWMGFERKRGKLADLNALLRGGAGDRFARVAGDLKALAAIKYVITLDTDTDLPRESARQLVGVMAHPLNQPRLAADQGRVIGGYGILQPRMAASLSATSRSPYARLFGTEPGIDPYTRSVSDVYQDAFGEGSFIGKGIYDVDAFEAVLRNRLPENRILSHDLLEGCFVRSGLLSDVQLYEEYPAGYLADVKRRERWIRGDWQIASWLLPWVPTAAGTRRRNPLTALSRWKILDNLRRSVVPAALLALLLLGWALPVPVLTWTLAVLAILLLPVGLIAAVALVRKPDDRRLGGHLREQLGNLLGSLAQSAFGLACLPYEAAFSLLAILRSSYRLLISKRRLLSWNAADQPAPMALRWSRHFRLMWPAPLTAVLAGIGLAWQRPAALAVALPVLGLWLLAPAIAGWMSRSLPPPQPRLSSQQIDFLRRMARKTWSFFDRFAGPEDHWLVPDNYQEQPGPVLAHRTSPTNIGMSLLANLCACDFGYIGMADLLDRTRHCFDTLAVLERHQGHFFNWYDTRTLQPLLPRYVSTVDSGNLAGHLLTLRAGLLALPEQSLIGSRAFEGLRDTLLLCAENPPPAAVAAVDRLRALLDAAIAAPPATLAAGWRCLDAVNGAAAGLADAFAGDPASEAGVWAAALEQQAHAILADLCLVAPWLGLPAAAGQGPIWSSLDQAHSLRDLADRAGALVAGPGGYAGADRELLELTVARAVQRIESITGLAGQTADFAAMSFEFLYDRSRHLLAIGYNADQFRRDASFYDLLASEARLGNFVAIAQGQLPQESWFALGRLVTTAGGRPVLVSWSGSMFEYLMPMLVMPTYPGSLLDQTCRAAVARQIAYGDQHGLPWGVSESGYNIIDASQHYQYHAFGVPGLGLKRGLAEDLVVAPYASVLALMVAPEAATANLQRLAAAGLEGRHGFYEAVDYTASRLLRGQTSAIVRSFMAHHQGMNLLAFAWLLLDRPMQRRFASDPGFQATLLLLQERTVKAPVLNPRLVTQSEGRDFSDRPEASSRTLTGFDTPTPAVALLSNGRYQVMVSNAGGGYSRWKNLALGRWREDATRDHWGSFVYLRDDASGEFWSAAQQPTLKPASNYQALFSEGRAEFRRIDHGIETHMEIAVSPEDDIELRRVRISNRSHRRRVIEVTSYAEVVLAPPAQDASQTAFGNLFVQTELLGESQAILCTRRPRSAEEATPWLLHLLGSECAPQGEVSFETDRMRFIGRGRSVAAPRVLSEPGPLSGTSGSVLDPIVAIRCRVTLEPDQSQVLDLVTGAAESRAAAVALVAKYRDCHHADRVFDLASTHSGVTLRQINASESDAQLYAQLASAVIYANAALRADAALLVQNRRGQSALWAYAISGDLPIVLLRIADSRRLELAQQMIQCHAYWRLKGLAVDLVIWNEEHVGYRQRLQDQIMGLITTGSEAHSIDRPGGIFVRSGEQISPEDRILLQTVARVIVADSQGSLSEQVNRPLPAESRMARLTPTRVHRPGAAPEPAAAVPDWLLGNGIGGFSADGSEYLISTSGTRLTPLPWVNVLANPNFGTVLSESGLAYSWSENAHEFRLTPWSDDPVGASGGEAFYLRDEESGHYWSPTPLPSRSAAPYLTRHGFGYSVFEHDEGGLHSELWVYVDLVEPVKYSVLKVHNRSGRRRHLSATGYVEWVLGEQRTKSAMHIVTEVDAASGALFARNPYNTEFAGRVGFFDVDDLARSVTGDREEFLGRNHSIAQPDAMSRTRLSGRLGAALDPCAALQVPFELADGAEREIIFRLGAGLDRQRASQLAQQLRQPGAARMALERVRQCWRHTLSAVRVETPDPALDLLANGWLLYQTLACRIWARSGYYQSGGAFGFRDQLQDAMALVHAEPQLLRAHLLRSAGRQYPEGDVQHWWHPPQGRGVRTRCSDDYLWLPFAVARYVAVTGDAEVLDETVHFLEGRTLVEGEESYYDLPGRGAKVATLFLHCVRAIEHGLRLGERGLPLIGSGDWNDGMNLVGIAGRGESVWLGFFLYRVLLDFAPLASARGDERFATRCRQQAEQLRQNLERHAWDGDWYRRAWFDDGTPLGSSVNAECSIDAIAQSWSVLSGAGSAERSRQAMDALDRRLVHRDQGLVQLLDPPFDSSAWNPGYIRGYVPGVRENGGQYTHAAIWATMAFAALGDSRRAWELLDLINPVRHTQDAAALAVYQAEPYVVAADVYAIAPHTGRGGWTWYTGSAGWMYRLITESLLGLVRQGDRLQIRPCLPAHWSHYKIDYRFGESSYRILITQTAAADGNSSSTTTLDEEVQEEAGILLVDDRREHLVAVSIRRGQTPAPASVVAADPA